MDRWNDEEHRRLAFDYLRGDLEPDVEAQFEEHLVESAEFADYVSRLQELLQSPKKAEVEWVPSFDKDLLFDRIAAEVQGVETTGGEVVAFPTPPKLQEPDVDYVAPSRHWSSFAAAAVVLLGACFLGYLIWDTGTPVAPIKVAHIEPLPKVVPKLDPVQLEGLELGTQSTPEVQVFADKGATWSLEGATDKALNLDEGTVLVEFVPTHGEALEVQTKHFKIRVLGTVFYASDDEQGSVGVVTGKVQVVPNTGEPVILTSGQEYVGGVGVRPMPSKQLAAAETHVDVGTHLDRLAGIAVAAKAEPTPVELAVKREKPEEVLKKPRKTKAPATQTQTSIVWRDQANKALRARRYEEASSILEHALRDLDANDPTRGAIRLDLSRIYINKLQRPSQAAVHLKRFVKSRPNDVATPTARAQLCRILTESGRTDPLCVD